MPTIKTLAWVLCSKDLVTGCHEHFRKELISFEDISEEEILIEPLYGGWEANMTHALERKPVDVCQKRREPKVVLGNSGVVRVLKTGRKLTRLKPGDVCVFIPYGPCNRHGFLDTAFGFGFDEPGTIGMLAKQTKVKEYQLVPVPETSRLLLHQWPIISVRFGSGWSNWLVTLKCWEAQVSLEEFPSPHVFGWGGGVTLSELLLAKEKGFKVSMIASCDRRLEFIKNLGITAIDRRQFYDLYYDHEKYETDREYRRKYFASLNTFRRIVDEITEGEGVSIFIENIGLPVYPATMRVLGRPGIIATTGWKKGMSLEINRALECHYRHIHVFTHAIRLTEGEKCIAYAAQNNWIPNDNYPIYDWEDIPQLAHDYADGKITSYFPTFRVNQM